MWLWLFAIALLLFAWNLRERFTDPDSPVTRPARNAVWLSKIDSQAPLGGNDDDYIRVLQAFYDKVYLPSPTRPKDTDLEAFLKSPDAQGVDPNALRKIITAGFRIELTQSVAAREEAQAQLTGALAGFKGNELQPGNARDGTYGHMVQGTYVPADMRKGELPEGIYDPTPQQDTPRREGIWDWKARVYSVCLPNGMGITSEEACAKNVL